MKAPLVEKHSCSDTLTEQVVRSCCESLLQSLSNPKAHETNARALINMSAEIIKVKLCPVFILHTCAELIQDSRFDETLLNEILRAFKLKHFFSLTGVKSQKAASPTFWQSMVGNMFTGTAPRYSFHMAKAYVHFVEKDDKKFQCFVAEVKENIEMKLATQKTQKEKLYLDYTLKFTDNPDVLPELLKDAQFYSRLEEFRRPRKLEPKLRDQEIIFGNKIPSRLKNCLLAKPTCFVETDIAIKYSHISQDGQRLVQIIRHEFPDQENAAKISGEIARKVKEEFKLDDAQEFLKIECISPFQGKSHYIILFDLEKIRRVLINRDLSQNVHFVPPTKFKSVDLSSTYSEIQYQ